MSKRVARPLLIEWVDSVTSTGWSEKERLSAEPASILSAGWIMKRTRDALTVAGTIDTSSQLKESNCRMVIPRKSIIRITRLEEVKHG